MENKLTSNRGLFRGAGQQYYRIMPSLTPVDLGVDKDYRFCKSTNMSSRARRLLLSLVLIPFGLFAHANEIVLSENDLVQMRPSVWTALGLNLSATAADNRIVGPQNKADGARLLRIYSAQGDANGFAGVVYDNRDRGHSALDPALYPTLAHLKYNETLTENGFDFGLAGRVMLPAVVLGNSSTAMRRGPTARSLPRLAMTNEFWRETTPELYSRNHIYVYPEHRDFDDEDRFPVNWPYMITSEGSSYSDLRFLNAVAMTLAAFPKETFEFLRKEGLVAPTVQMIMRRNLSDISDRDDYLSGRAHPSAFYGPMLRPGRMVEQAALLQKDEVPPLVRLRVVEEDFSEIAGLAGWNERLVDTPAAIGRLWRSFAWEREMVVTTDDTIPPNALPLKFEWKLLRGDTDLVKIEPLDTDGRSARIRVKWHEPWNEPGPGKKGAVNRIVSRVDIGVFANNGVHDSAPSFVSIDFPGHQRRQYTTLTDGGRRLLSIDYDARGRSSYFDPLLYWTAAWSDKARYDKNGTLMGWYRTGSKEETALFIPTEEDGGRALHEITKTKNGVPILRRLTK